jgi:phosphocarrier protein HPr
MVAIEKDLARNVTIINELGLHARSAAKISKIAQQATAQVWIIKEAEKVDAASIIDILTLACIKGSRLTIKIDDPKDIEILNDIEKLVKKGFGE